MRPSERVQVTQLGGEKIGPLLATARLINMADFAVACENSKWCFVHPIWCAEMDSVSPYVRVCVCVCVSLDVCVVERWEI